MQIYNLKTFLLVIHNFHEYTFIFLLQSLTCDLKLSIVKNYNKKEATMKSNSIFEKVETSNIVFNWDFKTLFSKKLNLKILIF